MRPDLIDPHIVRNSETADLRDSCKSHRERVMQLIESTVSDLSAESNVDQLSSVVLLGAGNCLDVDLIRLARLFQHIHLVDLDVAALSDAVADANSTDNRLQIHAPQDIAEPLLAMMPDDLSTDDTTRLANSLKLLSSENGVADVPESDIVVSLCLFSHLVVTLSVLLTDDNPAYANALKAIRLGHIRRMLSMLRPGGVAIFITEIVSSETAPKLIDVSDSELPELIRELVNDNNFFSGTNPSPLLAELNLLSRLPGGPETVDTIDPWKWQMGDRTYAVYAMRIQKKIPLKEEAAPAADD